MVKEMEKDPVEREIEDDLVEAKTKRGAIKQALEKSDPELAKMLDEASPEERAWGKLIGALMDVDENGIPRANSAEKIEDIFIHWENEFQEMLPATAPKRNDKSGMRELSVQQRMVAFFHALGSMDFSERNYRVVRKMFVAANTFK